MKNATKKLAIIAIYIVIFIALNAITFLSFDKETSFWLAYGFTAFSLVLGVACTLYNYKSADSYMLKLSSVIVSHIYVVLCVIYGFTTCIFRLVLAKMPELLQQLTTKLSVLNALCGTTAVAIVYVVLTSVVLVVLLIDFLINHGIIKSEKEFSENRSKFNDLLITVNSLRAKNQQPELDKELFALGEKVQYSQLYGNDSTKSIEQNIREKIMAMYESGSDMDKIKEVISLIDTRNEMLKRA